MQSTIPTGGPDVASRVAQRTLAKRGAGYAAEVRRLLDAALEVMAKCGTTSRPRVSDIVAAAGLSNDAFYRHFPSKDALVTALLEDGAERLHSYLDHQMKKEATPEGQVRRWVEGVLSQTRDDLAAVTLAVQWNGSAVRQVQPSGHHFASAALAGLLHAPFAELGSADPEFDASLAAHATLGKVSDYLWRRSRPTPAELDHMVDFVLAAVGSGRGGTRPPKGQLRPGS